MNNKCWCSDERAVVDTLRVYTYVYRENTGNVRQRNVLIYDAQR